MQKNEKKREKMRKNATVFNRRSRGERGGHRDKSRYNMSELITDCADYADYGESKYELPSLDHIKRKIITQTLEFTKDSRPAAAKILGIEPDKLNRLIERLNISP